MLCREVGRAARAQDFRELDNSAKLLLLQPEYANINVEHSTGALPLESPTTAMRSDSAELCAIVPCGLL